MDEFALLLLCAETDTSDPLRGELLWQMLTIEPEDLALSPHQTVVAIFGTVIDPDDDYARQPQVQVVVRPDGLLRRPVQQLEAAVRTISSVSRPLVLFLGAGASATSGILLGNAYRDRALRALLAQDDRVSVPELEDLFFDWCHDRDRFLPNESDDRALFRRTLTLERVLRETFQTLGPQPRTASSIIREISEDCATALGWMRPGRRAVRNLIEQLKGRLVIVTVNFDQLIEHELGAPHRVFSSTEGFRDNLDELAAYLRGDEGSPVPILKLHGTIEQPDSLIATVDVTSAGFNVDVRAALQMLVSATATPLTWVWIGCSMRDRDLNDWLRGLGQDVLDEWWIDPLPSSSLYAYFDELRRSHWTQNGRRLVDRLVIDSGDRFLDELDRQMGVIA
jgi:hypothetical protein